MSETITQSEILEALTTIISRREIPQLSELVKTMASYNSYLTFMGELFCKCGGEVESLIEFHKAMKVRDIEPEDYEELKRDLDP